MFYWEGGYWLLRLREQGSGHRMATWLHFGQSSVTERKDIEKTIIHRAMVNAVGVGGFRLRFVPAWPRFGSSSDIERMNIFTTDHPLNSQTGVVKNPGLGSYCFGIFLAAAIVCPFLAMCFWFGDVTDNGGSTGGYTPAPFWMDCLVAAVMCLLVAFAGISALLLFAALFRKFSKKRLAYTI